MKALLAVLGLLSLSVPAPAGERSLRAELVLEAPVEEVFAAWATAEGARTFFAPDADIEPKVGGRYEILFDPAAPAGQRGAEGLAILQYEPPRRLAFTWDAPPRLPEVRAQRTWVVLDFEALGPRRTRLTFRHEGWGRGPGWDEAYDYFDRAWGAVVLPRLQQRFTSGPLDWTRLPRTKPLPSLQAGRAARAAQK